MLHGAGNILEISLYYFEEIQTMFPALSLALPLTTVPLGARNFIYLERSIVI